MSCAYPGCTKSAYPGGQYCSKYHRDAIPPSASGTGTCRTRGCNKPAYPGGVYCSKGHRDAAAASNPRPNGGNSRCHFPGCSKTAFPGGKYCSKSHRDSASSCLIELASTDSKFRDVSNQFDEKWLHNKPRPVVHKIFKIVAAQEVREAYEDYRGYVEQSTGLSEGNQRRRFHGTTRTCTLGEYGGTALCNDSGCSLCGIIRSSFKMSLAGSAKPWRFGALGRFGGGIYTTSTTSKADDYSANKGNAAGLNHKTMLLTKVVVGRSYKVKLDHPWTTQPPSGYNSVIGEPGITLNYDELVVYNEHAIPVD